MNSKPVFIKVLNLVGGSKPEYFDHTTPALIFVPCTATVYSLEVTAFIM